MRRKTSIFYRSILSLAAAIALQAQAADARYMVYMNPFVVQKYEQEAIDAGYVRPQVPDSLTGQERDEYIARNMDALSYSPGIARLADELAREFALELVDKPRGHVPNFFVVMDDDKAAALRQSGQVVSVTKLDDGGGRSTIGIGMADARYMVYMNPFVVQKYEQEAMDAGYVRPQVPSILRPEEISNYIIRNIDEFNYSPGVARLQSELAAEFSLRDSGKAAMQTPAFFAYLDLYEANALARSERVVSVKKINEPSERRSSFSSYNDYTIGGETIPWGKQAVNADDGISTENGFYIVDTKWASSALGGEINMVSSDDTGLDAADHSAGVLSIAVARRNSEKIRGINPGQPVIHLGTDLSDEDIADKIALISSMAEWRSQFSTLNLSINNGDARYHWYPSLFSHDQILGNAVRRATGRLLVVQSAGNSDEEACWHAFNYKSIGENSRANDGVLVVGGTDRFGNRYPQISNPPPFATEPRSNFGPCVEVWAPGASMTTTLASGNLATLTGTSFAAPIVAALAGRYGSTATRPIEREAYIRNNMMFTGKYEQGNGSNLPIYQARYVPPAYNSIPNKLPVAAVYSDTNPNNRHKLIDEKFYDGIDWNAGTHWGSIVLDLGSQKNVKGIRVMMRSSSNGGVLNFAAHGGNTINITGPGKAVIPDNPIAWLNTTDQYDLVPYYIPLSGNWRYVMLQAHNVPSWLSYSEVEVYGF